MPDKPWMDDGTQWVIWNGSSGLLGLATLGKVVCTAGGRSAWLASPFHMVGPFSLDELEATGWISFAACLVMSRSRWQVDQRQLRQEAFERRRASQERLHAEHARFNRGGMRQHPLGRWADDGQHRQTLNLPVDGALDPSQVRAAFRRLAQKTHPDVGGSHEQFLRITEARNALLERCRMSADRQRA